MNKQLHIRTIDSSEVAESANGAAWVKLYTRVKGKYRLQLGKYQQIMARVTTADSGSVEEQQAHNEMLKFEELILPKVVAALVHDWNWIDHETGELFGKFTAETFRDELDIQQQTFITKEIYQSLSRRDEANPTNGDSS